jgi:RNA polymerase sigma factor (TIGR02999 family)
LVGDPAPTTPTNFIRPPENGEASVDRLFAGMYEELREIARRQRRRWRDDPTLNTTALLHEAYVKLAAQHRIDVRERSHFLAMAARAMRHILCNYSRDQRALKRGGSAARATLDTGIAAAPPDDSADALAALDDALERLERCDPRQSRIVECRFFGGLTIEETAEAIGISPRTVKRDWAMAQAWLHRELTSAG